MTYTVSSGTLNSTIPYHSWIAGVRLFSKPVWRPDALPVTQPAAVKQCPYDSVVSAVADVGSCSCSPAAGNCYQGERTNERTVGVLCCALLSFFFIVSIALHSLLFGTTSVPNGKLPSK